jgi:GT2 family glycosyltransferase
MRNQLNFPLVSIVISNYNGGSFLKECLTSLMRLRYPRYEVIVVDACSTDGSPEMVKKCFPKVTLIEKKKIGIGEAINIGIKKGKGEIIIFDFNTDEVASSSWLGRLVNVLNSSPDIGIVGGTRVLYGSSGIIDEAGAKIHFFGHQSKIGKGKKVADYPKHLREVDYVGCITVKREVIDKIGLLDEDYFIYGEDADFCLRAKKKGYKIIQVPQAVTYHRVSATIKKDSARQVYFLKRAQIRLALKLFSFPRIFMTLIWIGFLIIVEAIIQFPLFKRLILNTPYSYLIREKKLDSFKASLDAVLWNLKNMRSTISVRLSTAYM